MTGTGYADFVFDEFICDGVIISFEQWVPISNDTKLLYAIARYTAFFQLPNHRVWVKDADLTLAQVSKLSPERDSGVGLFS